MPFDNDSQGVESKYSVVTITEQWLLNDSFLQAYLQDI